ncbi:nicotinate-nucleotide adenylyltransferase [Jiella sp. LLJ827]|nr:nicotinate-nucleotide adenylyltransferase [Jiella sp. LLJ827]
MTVGLLGGSFNPPHAGHRLVADTALRRLGLHRVWWVVTPGNPLKDHGPLRPLEERIAAVRELAPPAHFDVTAFEAVHQIRYTADTLALVRQRRPGLKIVWVMGADSMASFHRWQHWREIADTVPIAVVDRPGATLKALASPFARRYAAARLPEEQAARIAHRRAPAWVFLFSQKNQLSSSLLRDTWPVPS